MQLASPIASFQPAVVAGAADLVSPARLFAIAGDRLRTASSALRIGGPGAAPTAGVTTLAIREVEAGVRALRSTLVPTTPFHHRAVAIGSIEQATSAIALLDEYRAAVSPLGDVAIRRGDLSVATLTLLDDATSRLVSSITRLAPLR